MVHSGNTASQDRNGYINRGWPECVSSNRNGRLLKTPMLAGRAQPAQCLRCPVARPSSSKPFGRLADSMQGGGRAEAVRGMPGRKLQHFRWSGLSLFVAPGPYSPPFKPYETDQGAVVRFEGSS